MTLQPLQTLLAEPEQAGTFYLTASDLAPLLAAAGALGFRCITLDLGHCDQKAELLRRLAVAFAFPAGLGHNWDALADCLGDLSWLPAQGYVLGLTHPQALRDAAVDDYATLVSILEGASLEWRERNQPFWTFIALPDAEFEALPP